VYQRKDPQTGAVIHNEALTNRRILNLIIYGERAHMNAEMAAIVRSLRNWDVASVLLDNEFNNIAARFLVGLFYLQAENAAFYRELVGDELAIDWSHPSSGPKNETPSRRPGVSQPNP
jgi:hypothetical protein